MGDAVGLVKFVGNFMDQLHYTPMFLLMLLLCNYLENPFRILFLVCKFSKAFWSINHNAVLPIYFDFFSAKLSSKVISMHKVISF